MAPGQVITASIAAVAGAKSAGIARGLVPLDGNMQTIAIAGGGLVITAAGVAVHRKANGSGYAGPALVGYGLGMTLGAVSDHFGF